MDISQALLKLAHQDMPLPLAWRVRCLMEEVTAGRTPPPIELPLLETVQLSAADMQLLTAVITWKEAEP